MLLEEGGRASSEEEELTITRESRTRFSSLCRFISAAMASSGVIELDEFSVESTRAESTDATTAESRTSLLEDTSTELDDATEELEVAEELLATLELETVADDTGTTLELDGSFTLLLETDADETGDAAGTLLELGAVGAASLDWVDSASASNSAKGHAAVQRTAPPKDSPHRL